MPEFVVTGTLTHEATWLVDAKDEDEAHSKTPKETLNMSELVDWEADSVEENI